MFTEVELVREAVAQVLTALARFKRGDTVPWAVIEGAGIERYTQHWRAFWHRLQRDYRRQTGAVLWAVPGVGMKVLTVDEQIGFRSRKRMRKAARQLHRDVVELNAIPDSQMNNRQKQERAVRVQAARQRKNEVARSARIESVMSRPNAGGMPRPASRSA